MSTVDERLACRPLTVRGVRQILTRAHVDQSALTLEAVELESTTPGRPGTVHAVRVIAPEAARAPVRAALTRAGCFGTPLSTGTIWDRRPSA